MIRIPKEGRLQRTVYVIQHASDEEPRWSVSNCGSFLFGSDKKPLTADQKTYLQALLQPTKPSGLCWQETGIEGAFSAEEIEPLLVELARRNPQYRFRIARIELDVRVESVAQLHYPSPTP